MHNTARPVPPPSVGLLSRRGGAAVRLPGPQVMVACRRVPGYRRRIVCVLNHSLPWGTPAMRKKGKIMTLRDGSCPECGHAEVIETQVAEFGHSDIEKPMCVTYDPRWAMGGRNPRHGHGPLRLYTCRSCGLSQWYADSPEMIPIGPDHRTRLFRGGPPHLDVESSEQFGPG